MRLTELHDAAPVGVRFAVLPGHQFAYADWLDDVAHHAHDADLIAVEEGDNSVRGAEQAHRLVEEDGACGLRGRARHQRREDVGFRIQGGGGSRHATQQAHPVDGDAHRAAKVQEPLCFGRAEAARHQAPHGDDAERPV